MLQWEDKWPPQTDLCVFIHESRKLFYLISSPFFLVSTRSKLLRRIAGKDWKWLWKTQQVAALRVNAIRSRGSQRLLGLLKISDPGREEGEMASRQSNWKQEPLLGTRRKAWESGSPLCSEAWKWVYHHSTYSDIQIHDLTDSPCGIWVGAASILFRDVQRANPSPNISNRVCEEEGSGTAHQGSTAWRRWAHLKIIKCRGRAVIPTTAWLSPLG